MENPAGSQEDPVENPVENASLQVAKGVWLAALESASSLVKLTMEKMDQNKKKTSSHPLGN